MEAPVTALAQHRDLNRDLFLNLSPVFETLLEVQRWLTSALGRVVNSGSRPGVATKWAPAREATRGAFGQLTVGAQWEKVTGVLNRARDHADTAAALQVRATSQLDLAQYGLITLRDELSAVMSLPSRRDGRDGKVVQMFGAAAPSVFGQALAA